MDLYKEIEREKLVSPSLCSILFGDSSKKTALLKQITSLPRIMYDVCMFYSAVLEIIYVNNAVGQTKTLYEYIGNKSISGCVKDLWVNEKCDLSEKSRVISFLGDCAQYMPNKYYFGDDLSGCLIKVREMYDKYNDKGMIRDILGVQNTFLELLRNLPLLADMAIDTSTSTINDGATDMRYEPFMFVDKKGDKTAIKVTVNCMKGEENHVLDLRVYEINDLNSDSVRTKRNYYIGNDENSRLVFSTIELNTNWYKEEEYLGNCAFVVKVSRVLCETVLRDIREHKSTFGVLENLKHYFRFEKSSIIRDIEELEKKVITVENNGRITFNDGKENSYGLQNFFMGLIIKYGAFQTVHDFFYDEDMLSMGDNEYKINFGKLFDTCIKTIHDLGIDEGDEERVKACIKEHRDEISRHINELNSIMPRNEKAFINRRDHIFAEQRASCILNIIGLKNDDMFMNQESMFSIHDYCDLITYRCYDLKELIFKLTKFLIRFYSCITHVTVEVPEDLEPWKYVKLFRDYCESVKENKDLLNKIGRRICDVDYLDRYIRMFKEIDVWESDGLDRKTDDYFFVSYCHADWQKVKDIVEALRKEGYNIQIDREEFDAGDRWDERAVKLIDDCKGVLSFISKSSVKSGPVLEELKYAEGKADILYKDHVFDYKDKMRFIIPINISGERDLTWIDTMTHDTTLDNEVRFTAKGVGKIISSNRIFLDDDYSLMERLRTIISERLMKSGLTIDFDSLNPSEIAILSYLYFLKTGRFIKFDRNNQDILRDFDEGKEVDIDHCIFPLLISVKETKIKRDKVTILSYDIINGKKNDRIGNRVMLTSNVIPASDYYCIPNIHSCGECGEWISNPLLLSYNDTK